MVEVQDMDLSWCKKHLVSIMNVIIFLLPFPLHHKNRLNRLCQAFIRINYLHCVERIRTIFLQSMIFHLQRYITSSHERQSIIFFNAISLRGVKQDVEKLNVTDSCGCATHTTQEAALHNALIEFLERQALLGSWLSNRYRYAINPEVLRDLSPYTSLVENILDNGELHIFEIGHDLPGYNIVMFYFSHSATDAVQYSVGSKTSGSLADAITSAFAELYQCYTFLYSAVFKPTNLSGKAGSGYHLAFTKYNTQATKLIIPYLQKNIEFEIKTLDEVRAFPTFEHVELLKGLQLISSEVYFYHYYEAALKLHFIKVLSPDFFPHMSLDKLFDLNMLYAQKLGITMDNAYLELLPFP